MPLEQIVRLVEIIQHNMELEEDDDEEYDLGGNKGRGEEKLKARKYMQDEFDRDFEEDDNPKLNHSR